MTDNSRRDGRRESADDVHRGFRFDCPYCEEILQTPNVESVKDRGVTHLEDRHGDDLPPVFAETYAGESCHDNCGYVFPVGVEEVAGYECPNCGYDNFQPFLQRYLYWQIETV